MTSHLPLVVLASIAVGLGFVPRSARADDEGRCRAGDRRCDEKPGPTPPAQMSPSSLVPISEGLTKPPQARIAPEPIASPPAAAPPPYESPADSWPIEYVLRPQTLPHGLRLVDLRLAVLRPQSGALAAGQPTSFHSTLSLGVWARAGISERFEVGFSAPRLFCVASSNPSGCSDTNRYNGTEANVSYGLLQSRLLQLKLFAGLLIARSAQPFTFVWYLGTRAKILFGQIVALEMAFSASRGIYADPSLGDTFVRGSFVLDFNFQVTHHLLIFADVNPYAPLDRLDEIELESFAGASWTFTNRSEIIASAGMGNVIAQRSWDSSVPGSYYTLSVRFWF